MRTFRLPSPPELWLGPAHLDAWDSLGTLSLLVALEEAFQVTICEDQFLVDTLEDVARIVEQALAAPSGAALERHTYPAVQP